MTTFETLTADAAYTVVIRDSFDHVVGLAFYDDLDKRLSYFDNDFLKRIKYNYQIQRHYGPRIDYQN